METEKVVKCKYCEHVGRADNVRAHEKNKHEKIRPICANCAKDFYNTSSLKRHLPKCTGNIQAKEKNETSESIAVQENNVNDVNNGKYLNE